MIDNLSIAVHAFSMLTLLSVDVILLPRYLNLFSSFRGLPFSVKMASQELHKNVACCLEQVLEAAPHKTAALWPFASYLAKNCSKTEKTYLALLEKQDEPNKQILQLTSNSAGWPTLCGHWMQSRGPILKDS